MDYLTNEISRNFDNIRALCIINLEVYFRVKRVQVYMKI